MASSSAAFNTIDLFKAALCKVHFSGGQVCRSAVPKLYVRMFNKYKIKEWTNFPKRAAKMYVGNDKVDIDDKVFNRTTLNWEVKRKPASKKALSSAHESTLIEPCNDIAPSSSREWSMDYPPIKGRHGNSLPDFC